MKKTINMLGQTTIFDIIVESPINKSKPRSLEICSLKEFERQYNRYIPSNYKELYSLIELLGDLVRQAYASVGIEIFDFEVHHCPIHDGWDLHDCEICWNLKKYDEADETMIVGCTIRLFRGYSVTYWHSGHEIKLRASAHTVKRKGEGSSSYLVSDKNVFCEHLSDIVERSAELFDYVSGKVTSPKKNSLSKKSTAKISPIQKFIKEYDGYKIEDACSVASDDFKSYCRKLKSALVKEAKLVGFDSVTLKPNHYDMHGFFNKGDKYVYWSFSVERGDMPTYLNKTDAMHGFLYRTATSDKDYRGGSNHFTDLRHLCVRAYELI
ncbi:hypothetical protein [Butyrivibrio hungatei]|uniref:Uncharacterized protein n=1 Tax=Butyrivibrio hungatei TaxID=185008 RepID=A0A1D9P5H2_9FIRM|nr:hypothetical protein [Butyrivibrio hungatei]AOZ97866.1 hypothetical protein bhn_II067 [Butyrivibrio hungatei]